MRSFNLASLIEKTCFLFPTLRMQENTSNVPGDICHYPVISSESLRIDRELLFSVSS